ncbi:MAG: trehalose-6-phosphate synthase, partial [Candidatus Methanoperedens sp.]|nr:trehalose-6-phosphate synthase [Candidatus Methanoperedens sp.]
FPFYTVYDENSWKCYKHVNEMFCEAIMEIIEPDDIIWVHDYHLMLLPGLLKKKFPENLVGFFLHIPFPSFEIFRMLPKKWQKELLEGLLGADLAGFH